MLIEYTKPQQMGVDQLMHVGDVELAPVPDEPPIQTYAPLVSAAVGGMLLAHGKFFLGAAALALAVKLAKR